MFALIIAVIFGLGIGYFATQNTTPVTIHFGRYFIDAVPLYVVVVGSLLVGLFVAWILYVARAISSTVTIYGKEHAVKRARNEAADLTERVHDLEVENAQLEAENEQLRTVHSTPSEYPNNRLRPS